MESSTSAAQGKARRGDFATPRGAKRLRWMRTRSLPDMVSASRDTRRSCAVARLSVTWNVHAAWFPAAARAMAVTRVTLQSLVGSPLRPRRGSSQIHARGQRAQG